ncbi:hypothetical protein Tco_0287517 [Tanacetum coccineum]
MPKSIHVNHQDTAFYILKYHQTASLNSDERAIFKILERRFFHEGRVIHPSFLKYSSIRQIFSAINFDCLLDIDVKICLVFVLEFYKTVQILQNVDEAISIASIIRNFEITLFLHQFTQILRVPCEGVCMFSPDWYISCLPNFIDPNPIYLTPLDNPNVVRDAIFNERPPTTRRTVKGKSVVLNPYQMVLFEMNPAFRKWETILSENTICLSRNNDHPNACLVYMLYYLANQKPFNLAYYMAKRMASVIKSDLMVLPYAMLLTRLYRHVLTIQPCPITDIHYLMDHVMVPFTGGGAQRFLMEKGLILKHPLDPHHLYLKLQLRNKLIWLTTTPSTLLSTMTKFHPFLEEHR